MAVTGLTKTYFADSDTENCISCTLIFRGSDGKADGELVDDGSVLTFTASFRNQLNKIPFSVPTVADSFGRKEVLVLYTTL